MSTPITIVIAALIIWAFFFVAEFAHAGIVSAVLLTLFVVFAVVIILRRGHAKQDD